MVNRVAVLRIGARVLVAAVLGMASPDTSAAEPGRDADAPSLREAIARADVIALGTLDTAGATCGTAPAFRPSGVLKGALPLDVPVRVDVGVDCRLVAMSFMGLVMSPRWRCCRALAAPAVRASRRSRSSPGWRD